MKANVGSLPKRISRLIQMSVNGVSLPKRISRSIRQHLLSRVTPEGFTPISQYSPDDIFVAGFPKSGNTWFQTLIAGAVYGVLPAHVPMPLLLDLVPDVHEVPWYKRHSKVMFFKTHHLPDPRYRRVIFLLRDGRDAMVSYWHYFQAVNGCSVDFKEFMLNENQVFPCKWHRYVKAWFDNPFHAEMMVIRYEDLKADPVRELRRVCEFAGLERSEEVLNLAAGSATFDKMRSKEAVDGPIMPRWPKDKMFCRRGVVGSYVQEMPRDILEVFMAESATALQKCGYF